MTYELCQSLIATGNYKAGDMLNKLDVFFANNRLTENEYTELVNMVKGE